MRIGGCAAPFWSDGAWDGEEKGHGSSLGGQGFRTRQLVAIKGLRASLGRLAGREETTFSRLKIVCPGKPRTGPLLGVKAERIEINLSSGDWKRCLLYWLERCNWLVIDYNREMIFDRLDTLWKWKLCSCIFFSTDPCTVPCSVMIPRALGDFN